MKTLLAIFLLLPGHLLAQREWQYLGHDSFLDVAVVHDSIFFVASNEGRVVSSFDAGVHWDGVQLDTAITTVDAATNVVLAGALSGRIYRSLDRGETWDLIQLPRTDFIRSIRFVTEDEVLAISSNGSISKSSDKGQVWREILIDVKEETRDLDVIAPGTAVVITKVGGIFRSTDAGEKWTKVADIKRKLTSCNFSTPALGMIVGEDGLAMITSDSGITWKILDVQTINDFSFGIAFSPDRLYITSYGTKYESTDGGTTWTNSGSGRNRPLLGSCSLKDRVLVVGHPGVIAMTSDSARNWTYHTMTIDDLQAYHDIQVLDSLTYVVVGTDNYISISTNAGMTWSPRLLESHFADLYDVHFWSPSEGITVGLRGFTASTLDGGRSWTRNAPFTGLRYFSQIAALDSQSMLVRADSTIWVSLDRFKTAVAKPHSEELEFFAFGNVWPMTPSEWLAPARYYTPVTDTTGVEHTLLMRTTNAGDTWEWVREFRNTRMDAIHFISDSIGFLAGNQANIWKTTDGGENWKQVNEDTTVFSLSSISFADDRIGYAVGLGAQAWFTYDGGETWQRDTILTKKPQSQERFFYLHRVVWADSNTVLIPGKMGILKKRIDRSKLTQSVKAESLYSDLTFTTMPNPVTDLLEIRAFGLHAKFDGSLRFGLFDIQGRELRDLTQEMLAQRMISWSYFKADLSDLPNGTYLLKLTNGERTFVGKVVVLH